MVHRDFKPDNVLVGKDGRVRVVDFGLARARGIDEVSGEVTDSQRNQTLSMSVTQAGTLLGTPAYMAPEQMRGELADERTDQFSFCSALFESLYKVRPYRGDTITDLLDAIEDHQLITPPSGSKVPSAIRELVERGLHPEPHQRHRSVGALLDAIERVPRVRRRRVLAASITLGFAAVIAGGAELQHARAQVCRPSGRELAGTWDDARREAIAKSFRKSGKIEIEPILHSTVALIDSYAQRWIAMRGEACEATRVRGEQSEALLDLRMECLERRRLEFEGVVGLLTNADAKLAERGLETVQSLSELSSCANIQALRAPVRPPADARARARVEALHQTLAHSNALSDAARYTEAIAELRPAIAEAKQLGYKPLEAELLYLRGRIEKSWLSDFTGSEATLRQAIIAAEEGGHDAKAAEAAAALISLLGQSSHFDDALHWANMARAWMTRVGDRSLEDLLEINLGNVYVTMGKFEEGRAAYQRSLELREKRFGKDHPALGSALLGLGLALDELGRSEESLAVNRRALAIQIRTLGPEHIDTALSWNNIGGVCVTLKRWDEALAAGERALAIFRRAVGPEHYYTISAMGVIGQAHLGRGEVNKALEFLRGELELGAKSLGADSADLAVERAWYAEALQKAGRLPQALTEARNSLGLLEKKLGPKHVLLARPLLRIGLIDLDLHDRAAATAALERALAIDPTGENASEVRAALLRTKDEPHASR
jgi:tetratricopeptide (TPR) repeat protein